MIATLSAGAVLAGATEDVNNFGDTRGGALAGPMGLFVIIVLAIATVLLIRNMNKRLRRLPSSFSETPRDAAMNRQKTSTQKSVATCSHRIITERRRASCSAPFFVAAI